ncbi:MAG: LptE family protein [Balneolaceae bacterium]|nr:LptE family protein [Balneolaceae bacterium]
MALHKRLFLLLFTMCLINSGCLRYSFTGTSIPEGVNTIFIPFFPDQSNSGIGDLSDRLNDVLLQRFVNESKLSLANNEQDADAILTGQIVSYSNRPFSIGGNEQANQNQVQIQVRATFSYRMNAESEWENKSFSGTFTFDPTDDPIEGEDNAADEALEQIANNMFNEAVSSW